MGLNLQKLAARLCSNLTASQCASPKLSAWGLVEPGQASVGVDVSDVLTGGLTAVAPVNAKVYGGYFTCGLERRVGIGLSALVTGYGGGVGLGAGWGVPFIAVEQVGKLSGIKKVVLEKLGSSVQDFGVDRLKGLGNKGSWSAATRLVTGPDTAGDLVLNDFHDAYATVVGLSANATVNGVSGGLVIFSKQRPVLTPMDLVYAKAFGFMAGVSLAMSLDVEANSQYYTLRVSGG